MTIAPDTSDAVLDTPYPPPDATTVPGLDLLRRRRSLYERIGARDALWSLIGSTLATGLVGAAIFGMALGAYGGTPLQLLSSAIKLPLLLLGTAAICLPSFYVLQSWRSPSPLDAKQTLALQATTLGALGLVWASLAPPALFLITSTRDYRLSQLLALAIGAAGGVVGLLVLYSGCRTLCSGARGSVRQRRPLFLLPYCIVFGVVGSQLSWMLRPFIGSRSLPFQLFRPFDPSEGSFLSVALRILFG
jgi:hypothetical protein